MTFDIQELQVLSNELGVIRNTLEKVIRLIEILRFINNNEYLKNKLALKGGTAINLLFSNLPRLSVDIDLDYASKVDKNEMLKDRAVILFELEKYLHQQGYLVSKHSRFSYALDSLVISYQTSGNSSDNIKIEINYVLRSHIHPLELKHIEFTFIKESFSVLTVNKIEIFASKMNALLSRSQIRDLYDTYRLIENHTYNSQDIQLLKNTLLFYRFISKQKFDFDDDFNQKFTKYQYQRDLLPVLKKSDTFQLDIAIRKVTHFVQQLMTYDDDQNQFIQSTLNHTPEFDLIFKDELMIHNASHHPLVLWLSYNKE